jgi:cold shock CspA family protein
MKGNVRVIKLINDAPNYGFIRGEDGHDYFFHHTSCLKNCFDSLKPGAKVDFVPTETERGRRAEDVSQL